MKLPFPTYEIIPASPFPGDWDEYDKYRKSDKWVRKRDAVRERDKLCRRCHNPFTRKYELDVHHVTYDRLYDENLDDLRLVCRDCHTFIHEHLPYDPWTNKVLYARVWELPYQPSKGKPPPRIVHPDKLIIASTEGKLYHYDSGWREWVVAVRGGYFRYDVPVIENISRRNLVDKTRGQIILSAFYGIPSTYINKKHRRVFMECCHDNGVKLDDRLNNLRQDIRKENNLDTSEHETCPVQKLTNKKVAEARRLYNSGWSVVDLATKYEVTRRPMEKALVGKTFLRCPEPPVVFRNGEKKRMILQLKEENPNLSIKGIAGLANCAENTVYEALREIDYSTSESKTIVRNFLSDILPK